MNQLKKGNAFALELARDRFSIGCTQREYAARIGVPLASYVEWERATTLPSPENLQRILDQYMVFTNTRQRLMDAYAADKLRRKRRLWTRDAPPK